MLTLHRRHLRTCEHAGKGWNYTLCQCPVWCDGILNGVRIQRSLRTSDWARSEIRKQNLEAGGATSPEIYTAGPVLGPTAEAFLMDAATRNLAESTIASYRRTLASLRKALTDKQPVASVDVTALTGWRNAREVKARTARKELEHLRAFFAWCLDRSYCDTNPAKRLRMPLVDDVATMPFTAAEIPKLIAACDNIASDNTAETPYVRHRARALVYTLLYSGLRVSDVAQLRRSSLDPSTGHLTLSVQKTGVPLKVLLHPEAKRALESLPAVSPEYFFWTGYGDLITCVKNLRRDAK